MTERTETCARCGKRGVPMRTNKQVRARYPETGYVCEDLTACNRRVVKQSAVAKETS